MNLDWITNGPDESARLVRNKNVGEAMEQPDHSRAHIDSCTIEDKLSYEMHKSLELMTESKDPFEPEFGKSGLYESPDYLNKPRPSMGYYYSPGKKAWQHEQFRPGVYAPAHVFVTKAPASEMGANILGLAYTGSGHIKIRDDLTGEDFDEVLAHEMNHMRYPEKSEWEIREITKMMGYNKYQ